MTTKKELKKTIKRQLKIIDADRAYIKRLQMRIASKTVEYLLLKQTIEAKSEDD